MTQDYKPSAGGHPITPPQELIAKWASSICGYYEAARWGADQELEACCEWVINTRVYDMTPNSLRTARRPKPPSLKELALEILPEHPENMASLLRLTPGKVATIRRALEALDD